MAAENFDVKLKLVGDSKSAKKEVKETTKEIDKLDSSVKKVSKSNVGFAASISNLQKGLVKLGSNLKRVGGEFSRYITLPIMGLAALSIGDKLNGELRALGSELKKASDSFAQFLLPILRQVIGAVQATVRAFNSLSDATKQKIFLFASLAAAIGPVLIIMGSFATIAGRVVSGLTMIGKAITAVVAVLSGPVGIAVAIAAVIGILAGLINVIYKLRQATGSWYNALAKVGDLIKNAFINGALQPWLKAIEALLYAHEKLFSALGMKGLAGKLEEARASVKAYSVGLFDNLKSSFNEISNDLESVGSSWADAMTFGLSTKMKSFFTGFKADFKEASEEIEKETEVIGVNINDVLASGLSNLAASGISDLKSLGQAFKDFAKQTITQIAQLISRMLILRALQDSMPGLSNVGGTSGSTGVGVQAGDTASLQAGKSFMGAGKAKGGEIKGPGTGTSDSVAMWGSNGEYVLPARAVENIGLQNVKRLHMNAIGKKGFADGGLVQTPPSITIQNSGTAKGVSGVEMRNGVVNIILQDLGFNGPIARGIRSAGGSRL